ncbi:unnamed protein product [Paramecium pentaurelia]|uniref:Uncharacterized protein n=1 Tax=Paramecium pentaurelia TaxID=43138 RepID=A0A8S1VGI5_9CILI|nr:unnamed protein product [Paramecium pentaurelia]
MLFRFKTKREKRIKSQLIKAWNSVVLIYNRSQYTKNTKNTYFHYQGWFIQRTQMKQYIIANEELIQRQKLKLYQKYNSIMNRTLLRKIRNKQKETKALSCFLILVPICLIQDQLKKISQRIYQKEKSNTFVQNTYYLKNKTEKHMIQYKGLQQSKRYLQAIRKDNLLKLVIQTLRDTKNLIQKYNDTEKYLNKKKLKQLFIKLYIKAKIQKILLRIGIRSKSLQRKLFTHLQLQNKKKRYE